jgi:predicted secreted protein
MSTTTILAGIAFYVVTWAICLFVVLPWGAHSQSDAGEVVFGTDPGAPASFRIWKKLLATSILAAVVVALLMWGVSNPALQRYWH